MIRNPFKWLCLFATLGTLTLISSCKQELADPQSKSDLNFYLKNGNEEPQKAITLSNGNTAIVGLASDKGFLLVLSSAKKALYIEEEGLGNTKFTDLIETSDQGIVVIGRTQEKAEFPTVFSIVNKYSSSGELLWSKQFSDYFYSLTRAENGAIILSGESSTGSLGALKEIDENGMLQWTKYYSTTGNIWTSIRNTQILPNGNYLATCLTNEINYVVSIEYYRIIKLGKVILYEIDKNTKNVVNKSPIGIDSVVRVHNTLLLSSGILILADAKYHAAPTAKIFKYGNDFQLIAKQNYELAEAKLFATSDEEIYLTGQNYGFTGQSVVSKLNPNLEQEWSVAFGNKSSTPVHLQEQMDYLEILALFYDRTTENLALAMYSLSKQGKVK